MTYLVTLVVIASCAYTVLGQSRCVLTSCTEGLCGQLQNCLLTKERDGCARWEIAILAQDAITRCLYEEGQPCSLAPLADCYADYLYQFTSTAIPENERNNVELLAQIISGYLQRLSTNCSIPYATISQLEKCVVPVTQRSGRICPEVLRLVRQRYLLPSNKGSAGFNPWRILQPAIDRILGSITAYTRSCRRSAAVLVWPAFGPTSGGTNVTIIGALTATSGQRAVRVSFGNVIGCDIIQGKTTTELTVCQTRSIQQLARRNVINRPLEVFVILAGQQQTSVTVSTRNNFTYRADPVVRSLTGLETVVSGGTIVTISGTNLRSVRNPEMWITVIYARGTIRASWRFPSVCETRSDERMYCTVPPLVNPRELAFSQNIVSRSPTNFRSIQRRKRSVDFEKVPLRAGSWSPGRQRPVHFVSRRALPETPRQSDADDLLDEILHDVTLSRHARSTRRFLSRHKREACGSASPDGEQINDEEVLTFCVDVRLDDAPGVPESCDFTMNVFVDPNILQFTDPDRIRLYRPFWPVSDSFITIRGSRLTSGLDCSHFTVQIGDSICDMQDLTTDALTCGPPSEKPRAGEEDNTRRGFPEVVVIVGIGNLRFSIGFLEYHSNIFDNPAARYGIIGAIIGVLLIITVIAVVCAVVVRNRRR